MQLLLATTCLQRWCSKCSHAHPPTYLHLFFGLTWLEHACACSFDRWLPPPGWCSLVAGIMSAEQRFTGRSGSASGGACTPQIPALIYLVCYLFSLHALHSVFSVTSSVSPTVIVIHSNVSTQTNSQTYTHSLHAIRASVRKAICIITVGVCIHVYAFEASGPLRALTVANHDSRCQ